MMKKVKTWLAGFLCFLCAGTLCAAAALSGDVRELKVDAEGAHTIEISMNDFDETSFVYNTANEEGSSVSYSFSDAASLTLAGKDGIAVRVKNLSASDYSLFQLYVYVEDSTLIYSPRSMTATFYWASGGISTTKHSTADRYILVPGSFDGWMFLDFTQMVAVRTSEDQWDWSTDTWLSADGEGDNALPSGTCAQFGFFSAASAYGKELMLGAHTTFTNTDDGYVLDDRSVYADISTAALVSSEYPLAELYQAPSLTCNFTAADQNVTFVRESASVPYGYTLTVPAQFAAGYTQGTVTIGTGEDVQTQTTLAISNTYAENTTLSVTVASKPIGLDSSARVLDPDDAGATGANYGGRYPLENPISGTEADGIFLRVRNTLETVYQINTLYINGENGVQYSLLNTLITYVGTDGTVTTDRPASGATVKNRSANIPALFDGYMVIPFSELVATHVDSHINGTSDWNKFEADKLLKDTSDPWRSYPKCDLTGINIYFTRGGGNEGINELILGDFGTYTGSASQFVTTQTSALDPSVGSLTANGGLVTIMAYPESQLTLNLQVNGVSGVSDASIDLGAESAQNTLSYGEAFVLSPELALGYALSRIESSGVASGTLERPAYVNLIRDGGTLTLNFVTEQTAQVVVSEDNISLSDKAGIKVDVDNADGTQIEWQLVLTDGKVRYTASSKGAGLIAQDGVIVYGDVFTLPQGFRGTVYIPFNVYRGSTYGGIQMLPFDYAEGGKPASVSGTIYLNMLSGQNTEQVAQIFSGWEYVTSLPEPTKADLTNADLCEDGDADFVDGVSVDPMSESAASGAGQARPIKITPQSSLTFDAAGIAFRVRNISGQDFGWRLYAYTPNGVFVPQASNDYALIFSDGTVQEMTDTNRNMIIPAGFDGTVVAYFADYATDNAAADVGQNVVRKGLAINYFNLYSSGYSEGVLIGDAAVIGYDGALTALPLGIAAITDPNAGTEYASRGFRLKEIEAASVTVNSADVTLSENFAIYGTTVITLTPAAGKLITELTVPDGCSAQKNADGSYTVTIVRSVAAQESAYAIQAVTDTALTVLVTAGENGTVLYEGAPVTGSVVVPESADWYLSVTADAGYEAAVTADGAAVTMQEEGYLIPAGTQSVVVSFTRLRAALSVTVGENGAILLDGQTPAEELSLEQGKRYLLTVTPSRGYTATVMLNGSALESGEDGYELVVYGDGELSVTFAMEVYTISYDVDRGTNGDNPASYTVNDAVTFAPASKEGHTFLYWYTLSEDGEEVRIDHIDAGTTGDLTLYAKFSMNEYTGEFDGDGQNEPTPAWVWWTIGAVAVAVVAAGAVAAVVLFAKRKKK